MPEIRNCRRCRKLFSYSIGPGICDACKQLDEEDFEKVRKFVRDFPGASIQEVSAATEVSQNAIHKYLRDGRLEVSEDSPIAIQCENCGARIRSGRFCVPCSGSLAKDMMNAGKTLTSQSKEESQRPNPGQEGSGLRYKHRD